MNLKVVLSVAACLMLVGCASPKRYVEINGVYFRTTEAISAPIYSVGVVETVGRNRFEPKSSILISNLPAEVVTTVYSEDSRSTAVKAKIDAGKGSLGGEVDGTSQINGKYLIFRTLEMYKLVDEVNNPKNQAILLKLKTEKRQSAIITGVAIVYDNEQISDYNKEVSTTVTVTPTGTPGSISAGVEAKAIGKQKRSFSDGTIFAYEYSLIEWDETSVAAKIKSITLDRPNKFMGWWDTL